MTADDVLDNSALNRALLARQLLLERTDMPALDAIEHLVGMQSQAPQAPYAGLWTRLSDFDPAELSELMTSRRAVRIGLMRGTVHLVSAEDCLLLRPWLQPLYDRSLPANPGYVRSIAGIEDEYVALVTALLEEAPRTNAELRAAFAERWPDLDAAALTWGARFRFACVQVPPRGLWRGTGQATVTTAEHWLGKPLASDPSPTALIRRYLAAYGPASVQDMQTWCGLTKLGEHFTQLRETLRVFRSTTGTELFDLPDAPRPPADTPAPVRFLPEYDNLLRSHVDRTHVMSPEARDRLATKNDSPKPTFLLDGRVAGGWRLTRTRRRATLTIEPFVRLSQRDTAQVSAEAERLLRFAADGDSHEVVYTD
ncbi:MAG: winged helix DNA-binding domain-containing protein [Micromonosporaceae bacterium]